MAQGAALRTRKDQSLDPLSGSARTCPRRKAGKGRSCPFLQDRIIRELYVNRLSRHILTAGTADCSGIPRFY